MMTKDGGISIPSQTNLFAETHFEGSLDKAMEPSTSKISYIDVTGNTKLKTADGKEQVLLKKLKIENGEKVTVLEHEMLNETAKNLEAVESGIRLLDLLLLLEGSGATGAQVLSHKSPDDLKPKVMTALELIVLEETLTKAVISGMQTSDTQVGDYNLAKMMGIPELPKK